MAKPPFELVPPGPGLPTLGQMIDRERLIEGITELANRRRIKRPELTSIYMRVEPRQKRMLATASRIISPVNRTEIMTGLLDIFVPEIIAQRASPVVLQEEQRLAAHPMESREQRRAALRKLLDGLVEELL